MINPVFLIAVPLLLAFFTMFLKKNKKVFLIIGGVANFVFSVLLLQGETMIGGFKPPYGINLVVDGYSYIGAILVNLLFLAVILISHDLTENYVPVMLTAIAGLNGVLLTGDFFNLFVFLEIMTISAYILSGSSGKYRHTFNYLIIGSVGAVFYLLGIILLYSMTGSLNMADIAAKAAGLTAKELFMPTLLIFIGVGVEAKLIPFSGWVKGIYSNANRLVTALFSSAFVVAILFVLGRIFSQALPVQGNIKIMMIAVCIITFIFGEVSAFRQTKTKRTLMFSSIGQSGLAAALLVMGMIFPAVLLIINNVVGKLIMFSITGAMEEKYGTDEYESLKGVFNKNRLLGLSFTISALSIVGLPLFLGFYAKLNVIANLFSLGDYITPGIILLIAILEGAYFIRILIRLWASGDEGEEATALICVSEKKLFGAKKVIVISVLSLILLASGFLPNNFGKLISQNEQLLNDISIIFDTGVMKGGD